jgi:hypothetical protein
VAEFVDYGCDSLTPYRALLQRFVSGDTSAETLEHNFLAQYKRDATNWPEPVFRLLEDFFFDVDDYVADDGLRAQVNGIDAAQLRAKAVLTLQRLAEVAPED